MPLGSCAKTVLDEVLFCQGDSRAVKLDILLKSVVRACAVDAACT